ncbi:uncharacterized protein METZ01_LOCUS450147, partial [marine metagenome]
KLPPLRFDELVDGLPPETRLRLRKQRRQPSDSRTQPSARSRHRELGIRQWRQGHPAVEHVRPRIPQGGSRNGRGGRPRRSANQTRRLGDSALAARKEKRRAASDQDQGQARNRLGRSPGIRRDARGLHRGHPKEKATHHLRGQHRGRHPAGHCGGTIHQGKKGNHHPM